VNTAGAPGSSAAARRSHNATHRNRQHRHPRGERGILRQPGEQADPERRRRLDRDDVVPRQQRRHSREAHSGACPDVEHRGIGGIFKSIFQNGPE
jgi:hypothetical protein